MNILLLSCKTGGGHDAAAYAIQEQLEKMGHNAFVFDYLTLAGEHVSKRVANAYVKLVQTSPMLFGLVYKAGALVSKMVSKSPIYAVNKKMAKYLGPYLNEHNYDAIICTHLYPAETLTFMKRRGDKLPPVFFVMTDYTTIPFVEEVECDEYISPSEDLTIECIKKNMNKSKIHPFGIPFTTRILNNLTKEEAANKLGLDINKKIVLVIGGSMGAGKLTKIADSFNELVDNDKYQIVIICGNNKKIYDKLIDKYQNNKLFVILGHTKEMPLYMKAADIVYSKPGGLTSTEIAATNVPFVITNPIPGCETKNKEFFVNHQMAIASNKPKEAVRKGIELLNDINRVNKMKELQAKYIDSNTTEKIANYIVDYVLENK